MPTKLEIVTLALCVLNTILILYLLMRKEEKYGFPMANVKPLSPEQQQKNKAALEAAAAETAAQAEQQAIDQANAQQQAQSFAEQAGPLSTA